MKSEQGGGEAVAEEPLGTIEWTIAAGLAGGDEQALLAGFCARMVALGLPLRRASLAANLLHPIYGSRSLRWRSSGVEQFSFERPGTGRDEEEWQQSPFRHMLETEQHSLRRRLDPGDRPGEFRLLDQLRAEGATDYFAMIVRMGGGMTLGEVQGMASSWAADRPGGFRDDEIELLRRTVPALAFAWNAIASVATTRTLLRTYLGRGAAERVLAGNVERGRAETIRAVIWYSDLSDFTRTADRLPRDQLLAFLNDYAGCLVEVLAEHGGEVLKFVGDGMLAIFPAAPDGAACERALDAALAAEAAVATLNERRAAAGLALTDFHLALHLGEVLFGNFGSRERLDFTVLGPAVNEVARIEALCRSLDQRVIVSQAFAAAAGERRGGLLSLGRYALRGVARPEELFTIDRSAAG
ncbi:MAG: adenylate/guanylate cyclase domain-containing protein [Dongiaceae bacterium]